MKVTIFTSNQPRHLALVRALAGVADEVWAVLECSTVFPGQVADFFQKSPVMQRYFAEVIRAERAVFGEPSFLDSRIRTMALKMGDLSRVEAEVLAPALDADYVVVFGASYIKGPLAERLIARKAINIHMGTSPYYRGSSCNFWALRDGRPEMVGATLHLLSKGLDSGAILFHAFPRAAAWDPFELGMRAVAAAQEALVGQLGGGAVFEAPPLPQDPSLEIRYTRNADFTDAVAGAYLEELPTPEAIGQALLARPRDLTERAVFL